MPSLETSRRCRLLETTRQKPSFRDVSSKPSLETSRQMRLKRRLVDAVF